MSRTFVLCEQANHIEQARAEFPDAGIIALTPAAAWYCQEHQMLYGRLDDFVSPAAANQLADATLIRQYAWAEWVDRKLAALVPEFESASFTPARAELYFLKRSMDGYIRPAWILDEFARQAQPERLIVFERESFHYPNFDTPMPARPFFAWLAPDVLGDRVHIDVLPNPPEYVSDALPSTASASTPRPRPITPRRVARAMMRKLVSLQRRAVRARARLVWLGRGYDWEYIVPLLERVGLDAVVCSPEAVPTTAGRRGQVERVRTALEEHWDAVAQCREFWQPFNAVTPKLCGAVDPFLKRWLIQEVPNAWGTFLDVREWLQEHTFAAMIGVDVQNPFRAIAANAARSVGLPRALAIHTPPGGAADFAVQDAIGPIQSDLYLLNGSGDLEYFRDLEQRLATFPRGRRVATGAATYDETRYSVYGTRELRAQLLRGEHKPLVLYIPTQFRSYARYFCEGEISDVTYFELQQRILRVCAGFANVRILYKPFPVEFASSPMGEFIARCVPNAEVIGGRITELIWAVDAIIIDFPSTALAEAALTDKPIIVYAGRDWARLLPRARTALVKRAQVSETPDEFETHVRDFLARGDFAPLTDPNDEFLRSYVTHLNDGRSAERAAAEVVKLVQVGISMANGRAGV